MKREEIYKKLQKRLNPKDVYILCATILEEFYDDEIIERILDGDFEK